MADPTKRPSLRIAEFAITGFRTFHERVVIPLNVGGHADELAVFHGDNGAGKSNALAALDLVFRTLAFFFQALESPLRSQLRFQWKGGSFGSIEEDLRTTPRDWPPGSLEPVVIEVRFADEALGAFRIKLIPSGNLVHLAAHCASRTEALAAMGTEDWEAIPTWRLTDLKNHLETPRGLGSRALFVLDAHRRGSWRSDEKYDLESFETLAPLLAERLFSLKLSREPQERERWRAFLSLLDGFPTLKGKEISIDRIKRNGAPELHFEERGRQILLLNELSSGEQQIVALCAAILTSRASIVAIAEPEMSLSPTNQRLLRQILERQVKDGLIDQIILESHVESFDGPEVVRFKRAESGATTVLREARTPEVKELSTRAREKGPS